MEGMDALEGWKCITRLEDVESFAVTGPSLMLCSLRLRKRYVLTHLGAS